MNYIPLILVISLSLSLLTRCVVKRESPQVEHTYESKQAFIHTLANTIILVTNRWGQHGPSDSHAELYSDGV